MTVIICCPVCFQRVSLLRFIKNTYISATMSSNSALKAANSLIMIELCRLFRIAFFWPFSIDATKV